MITVIGRFKDNEPVGHGVYFTTYENLKGPVNLYEGNLCTKGRNKLWTVHFENDKSTKYISDSSDHFTYRGDIDSAMWLFGKYANGRQPQGFCQKEEKGTVEGLLVGQLDREDVNLPREDILLFQLPWYHEEDHRVVEEITEINAAVEETLEVNSEVEENK